MKVTYLFIFSLVLFFSCGKQNNPSPRYGSPDRISDPVKSLLATYVPKLQGERTWSSTYEVMNTGAFDTFIIKADTVFSIEVLNDSTISFLGRTLTFSRTLFWNGTGPEIDLDSCIYFTKPPDSHRFESMYYYYYKDDIYIGLKDGAMSGSWIYRFRSKD